MRAKKLESNGVRIEGEDSAEKLERFTDGCSWNLEILPKWRIDNDENWELCISREPKRSEDSTGENHMTSTDTYAADSAALLIVDPYNDFMSEGGITTAGAALANAVSNALGVEVTKLPLRPEYIMELVHRGDGSV